MGRRATSKSAKIRKLLAAGKSAKEIASALGVKPAYVHSVRWYDKHKSKQPVGRPRKVRVKPDTVTIPAGELEVFATYTAPKLTWGQRFSALFTGRV